MSLPPSPRAVVTGAASGLGRALCLELAKRGAKVLVSDIDSTGAEETAHAVEQAGGQALVQRCDVVKADEVEALAALADSQFGGSDLIANNAGVGVGGPVGAVALRDWEWVVGINLWGVIYGCHAFVPRFKRQGSGHVLNIASVAGLVSAPEMAPYNVTKAGVVSLSETLFGELAPLGIGVTVVCPSFFASAIVDRSRFSGADASMTNAAKTMMASSKVQAPDVAARALACCERDKLYCVPMADAQWGWRMKRLAPQRFYRTIMPGVIKAGRGR
jgi:NAD(P)-dependent dehydrogenase (short-subunit alcohol dehydrogenase family)